MKIDIGTDTKTITEAKRNGQHPAFPVVKNDDIYSGITTRDYFASKAMQGMLLT